LFGLIVILLLARRIKALLQKRSCLTDPKTAYFKSKAIIMNRKKLANFQPSCSQFSEDLIGSALCSMPVVFSATKNDRFQQRVINIPAFLKC